MNTRSAFVIVIFVFVVILVGVSCSLSSIRSDARLSDGAIELGSVLLTADSALQDQELKDHYNQTMVAISVDEAVERATRDAHSTVESIQQTRGVASYNSTSTVASHRATVSRQAFVEEVETIQAHNATVEAKATDTYYAVATRSAMELNMVVSQRKADHELWRMWAITAIVIVISVVLFALLCGFLFRMITVYLNRQRIVEVNGENFLMVESGSSTTLANLSRMVSPVVGVGPFGEVTFQSVLNPQDQAMFNQQLLQFALIQNGIHLGNNRVIEELLSIAQQSPSEQQDSNGAHPAMPLPANSTLTADNAIDHNDVRNGVVLLGVDDAGNQLKVEIDKLCHVAVAGATRQGKTSICRLILAQLIASSLCDVVICDPHYADVDPLDGTDWRPIGSRCMFPPASSQDEIYNMMSWIDGVIDERLEQRRRFSSSGSIDWRPIVIYWDELPLINERVPDAMKIISRILQEGAKVLVFGVCSAQSFILSSVKFPNGGVRKCFLTVFYVSGDKTTGQKLLDVRAINEHELGRGVAMLRSFATNEPVVVRVPYMNNEALNRLLPPTSDELPNYFPVTPIVTSGRQIITSEVTSPASEVVGSDIFLIDQQDRVIDQGFEMIDQVMPASPTPRDQESITNARIIQLHNQGMSASAIVKAIWNVRGGGRFTGYKKQVDEVIENLQKEEGV